MVNRRQIREPLSGLKSFAPPISYYLTRYTQSTSQPELKPVPTESAPSLRFDLTPGLPTTVIVVTFFSGVQLLSLGLLGEYVARIYDEVKGRPMYIVRDKVNFG